MNVNKKLIVKGLAMAAVFTVGDVTSLHPRKPRTLDLRRSQLQKTDDEVSTRRAIREAGGLGRSGRVPAADGGVLN